MDMELLPEDILLEIFSRVPRVRDLFCFAVTSRRWRRFFTDPDFLRRLWPETDTARLRGLFFHGCPGTNAGWPERRNALRRVVFVPRLELESPPGCDLTIPDDRDGEMLLASRHGVVLSNITVNQSTCCIKKKPDIHYRLVDPITGALDDVAPPLDCDCVNYPNGHAIFTAADLSDRAHAAFSELLLIGDHLDANRLRQHLHCYSAATRRWGAPAKIRHRARLRLVGARAAAVHRGAAHWLYVDDTVDASVPQSRRDLYLVAASPAAGAGRVAASVTRLPIKAAGGVPYLCVGRDGGGLSVARVHPTRVDVWTQQDDGDDGGVAAWLRALVLGKEWVLVRAIQMPAAAAFPGGASLMSCSWFHFRKGAMVAVYGGEGVFVVDLETEAVEKIMDLSSCSPSRGYYRCLPYEMDLPEFFLGHLGGSRHTTVKPLC